MKKIMKDALALTLITLVAGALLGGVYEITKAPIAQQEAATKKEAYQNVFKNAKGFEKVEITEELEKQLQDTFSKEGLDQQQVEEIMEAVDDNGNFLGYAFTIVSGGGYGGDIKLSVGVQKDGTVNGVSILVIEETAGLGMNATTEEFKGQYADKNVDKFVVTKKGAVKENEIDAISGATKTSNAMTNGVNAAIFAAGVMEGGN